MAPVPQDDPFPGRKFCFIESAKAQRESNGDDQERAVIPTDCVDSERSFSPKAKLNISVIGTMTRKGLSPGCNCGPSWRTWQCLEAILFIMAAAGEHHMHLEAKGCR